MRIVRLLTLGFCTLLPGVLQAQTVPSPFRFLETSHAPGIFGGYLTTSAGDLDLGPRSAPIFGARYTLHLTGPLSAEANLGFSPSERTIYARSASGGQDQLVSLGDKNSLLGILYVTLKFHVTGQRAWHGLAPYGVFGAGVVAELSGSDAREAALPGEQQFDFGPAFAATAGLGVDFFLTERLSVRLEGRDYLWRFSYPAGLTDTGEQTNDWVNNVAVTFGGALHF